MEDHFSFILRQESGLNFEKESLIERFEAVSHWIPCAGKLATGDIVKVNTPLMSSDESLQVSLPNELHGQVQPVDADGNAAAQFPGLQGFVITVHWVIVSRYKPISEQASAKAGEGGLGLPFIKREQEESERHRRQNANSMKGLLQPRVWQSLPQRVSNEDRVRIYGKWWP